MNYKHQAISEVDLLEGTNIIHLKVFGLWSTINSYRKKKEWSTKFKLNFGFTMLYVIPYFVFQILTVFYLRINMQVVTFIFLNTVPCIQGVTKTVVFCIRLEEQCTLIDLIKEDFLSCIPPHKQTESKEIYRKLTKRSNNICLFAIGLHIVTMTLWIAMPGIDAGNGRKKILGGWYPFPYAETPYYEWVYAYETVLMYWFGSIMCVYECLMVQLLMGMTAHFVVLSNHLGSLKKDGMATVMNCQLRAILNDYNKLLRYGEILKDVYNFYITVILGTGIAVLVITCLHLLFAAKDVWFTLKFLLFISYGVLETSLICLTSSFVETASSTMQWAAYCSDWYEADKNYKGATQMLIVRALKPITLVAVKMYPVNLETLIGIFQFIYTTCAVLSKMKE